MLVLFIDFSITKLIPIDIPLFTYIMLNNVIGKYACTNVSTVYFQWKAFSWNSKRIKWNWFSRRWFSGKFQQKDNKMDQLLF